MVSLSDNMLIYSRMIDPFSSAVPTGFAFCLARVYSLTMFYNLNNRSSFKHGSADTNNANSGGISNFLNGLCECLPAYWNLLWKHDCHPLSCAPYCYGSLRITSEIAHCAAYSLPPRLKLMWAYRPTWVSRILPMTALTRFLWEGRFLYHHWDHELVGTFNAQETCCSTL